MRKRNILWIVFALIIGAGIFWWTTAKKRVVRNAVTNAVQKKTDSLYKITYDTSEIDEVSGDVFLKNVRITLDSVQWLKLIEKDSIPPVTISLSVEKITIRGLKELKLLSNSSLDVSAIIIEKPIFRLDKWARKKPSSEPLNDTAELYRRLLGDFDFLRAKNIQVIGGNIAFINQLRNDSVSVAGINIDIDDFLVDSAHNYKNIVSYFIKQTKASVNGFNSAALKTGRINYDSKLHTLGLDNLSTGPQSGTPVVVKSIRIEGLSTDTFITSGHVNARTLRINEPNIVIDRSAKKAAVIIDTLFAGAIDSFIISKGNFILKNKKSKPILIKDVELLLKNVRAEKGKIPLENYINPASALLTIGSVVLPAGFHRVTMQQISYPGKSDLLQISRLKMQPTITRQELKTKIGKQNDMYTVSASNIILDKIDFKKLLKQNTLMINSVSLQMAMHVFNDKTLKLDSAKRESGRFPYEALQRSKMPIDVRSINVKNASIAYEEQAAKSEMNGTVFFTDVNGRLTNITNMPSQLAKDHIMKLDATARVMGNALLHSRWDLTLNDADGNLRVTGNVAPFPVTILSPAFEALSMAKIRSGYASKLEFVINGNHEGSKGTVLLNYEDLKVELLKKNKDDSLVKKGFLSFLANADIRNKNNSDKPKEYTFKKDRYKSLFNLLWKSVFEGGKKTILIVK